MSDLNKNDILDRLNLTEEQGRQLLEAAQNNPFEALGLLQSFNPDPEALQKLMAEFMTNPNAFLELAESLGFSEEQVNSLKNKFGQ